MLKVISFCVYGSDRKYCQGLLENLEIIKNKLPDFETWIYAGKDVPSSDKVKYGKYNIRLIVAPLKTSELCVHRFFPIDNKDVDVFFSRDADSRINDRDIWCMKEFIKSDKLAHVIRDNYWHKTRRIMGGASGFKRLHLDFNLEDEYYNSKFDTTYGSDELFIEKMLYPRIKDKLLVHSDIIAFNDEPYPEYIEIPNDGINFVGNVYEYDTGYKFNFWQQLNQNIVKHLIWLRSQKAWKMILHVVDQLDLKNFNEGDKYHIFNEAYISAYYLDDIKLAREYLSKYSYVHVDEFIINNSNYIFNKLKDQGWQVIGTTDVTRKPKDKEIIVIYGNYHHFVDNLPHCDIVKRHAIYFGQVKHDQFESHECWNSVSKIYILNLIDRVDRYMEIMVELCRMNAPLDRLHHYKVKKTVHINNPAIDPYIDCTKNHADMIRDFINSGLEHCLILEDDVTFTSNIKTHQQDMATFFARNYDYDICLITSSKYWDIKNCDDLLDYSYQICTTASGYMLSLNGAKKVYPIILEGLEMMKITKDTTTYANDRYWSKIQKDNKFFIFKNKFGYQRCSYSSITGKTACHFD